MNILYIVHQFFPECRSGTEQFLLNLASSLQQDGHAARVVAHTFADPDGTFERDETLFIRRDVYDGIPVTAVRQRTFPVDVNSSVEDSDIYRFAREFLQGQGRCDLMHIAHPMRMASFAKAALEMGIPYVLTLTDFWLLCPKIFLRTSSGALCAGPERGETCSRLCPELQPAQVKSRLAQARQILTGAKALVAPSMFVAAVFQKEFPDLKIQIIPHGLNLKHLKPNSRMYRQGEKIVFGYSGGLAPHKGVHLLLQAFRKLQGENAELRLYGQTSHEKDYLLLLQEIARADQRIQFRGTYKETETGEVLRNIDVMVIPSLCYETYSLTLHEALACNVPVIAANLGALPEKVVDSSTGFTFQAGSEADLRAKLQLILANSELLNGIKRAIRNQVFPLIEEEAYLYARLYKAFSS